MHDGSILKRIQVKADCGTRSNHMVWRNSVLLSRRKKVLGQGTVIFCRKMMFFVKEHFFLLLDWYYASPPGQDTWAKPNNCAETLTAICGSASPVFSHSPKKVLTWPYRNVTI